MTANETVISIHLVLAEDIDQDELLDATDAAIDIFRNVEGVKRFTARTISGAMPLSWKA